LANIRYAFFNSEIISHRNLAGNIFHLRIGVPSHVAKSFVPGKFSMLRVSNALDPLLNRPFSISFVDKEKNWLDIIYRVVGKGTKALSKRKTGDKIDIIPSLGHGFPVRNDASFHPILVGGGMGIAPLLSFFSVNNSKNLQLLWGIKNRDEYFDIGKLYPKLANASISISSEDGSIGMKGTVVDLFRARLAENKITDAVIYACGPLKMLHALYKICKTKKLPFFVSLETRMACGFGYCLGCAVPSAEGDYLKACQDGPVFDAAALEWEKIEEFN